MSTIKEMANEIDLKLTELNEQYMALHAEFDTFRGKPAGDDAEKINEVLHKIQTKFQELYPALYFIASRYQYACNITQSHEEFIQQILKAGGQFQEKGPIQ